MNDVTVSLGLYLKASNSLHEKSMTVLNANCHKNSWAKSSHERRHDISKEANQCWVVPLKDMGNSIIIWASSKLWASSQYYIVSNECRGIQSPCITRSLASWTWPTNWSLVVHQNHLIPSLHLILSTITSSAQAYPCVHWHPSRLEQPPWHAVGQPQSDSVK